MKTFSTICAVAITLACLASSVNAQGPFSPTPMPQGPLITDGLGQPIVSPRPRPQGPLITNGFGQPIVSPSPMPIQPVPQYPHIVTQPRFDGWSPWGINTRNEQIDNTYFMGNRGSSLYNGSGRYVNRPVYGSHGQIVGYERGLVWNNSVTGQEHGDLTRVTDNGMGGQLQTHHAYSSAGGNIKPKTGQ